MKDQKGENNNNFKHGLKYTREYKIWLNIKTRCLNKNNKAYKNYGGRGITLYQDWINNPELFISYIKNLTDYNKETFTLDRIDNNKNYEPGNLRWIGRHIQSVNQRRRTNKIGYTGIFKRKKKIERFYAYIRINSSLIHIGSYGSLEDAVNGRNNYIRTNNLTEYKIQEFKK